MRVLLIGPYPPPHGGVQTNLVAIRERLLRLHIPCAAINITRFRKPDGDEIYYPKSTFGLILLLWRLKYDVIHLHFGGDLNWRILGLGLVCCLIPHSKTVLTFHSGGFPASEKGRHTHRWGIRAFVLRRFNAIIGVNQEIVDFIYRLGVSPEKIKLITPFAFPEGVEDHDSPLPGLLDDFFDAHRPVLITVGLLELEYDLPLQIQVLGLVRKDYPNAGLIIIGAGSLESELMRIVAGTEYANHVLMCGDVPHPATLCAISKSDLMLRTTLYDGDAISVREALYLGTPVIATDNGMRPEGVRKFPVGNLAALRQAIEEHFHMPRTPRRSAIGSDNKSIEDVMSLYQELLQ